MNIESQEILLDVDVKTEKPIFLLTQRSHRKQYCQHYRKQISQTFRDRWKDNDCSVSGFTTLEPIAESKIEHLEKKVAKRLEKKGRKHSRSFLDLEITLNQASVLPKILER